MRLLNRVPGQSATLLNAEELYPFLSNSTGGDVAAFVCVPENSDQASSDDPVIERHEVDQFI